MISVLMVAEKPSIAKTLAEALSRGGRPSERKGVSLPVDCAVRYGAAAKVASFAKKSRH